MNTIEADAAIKLAGLQIDTLSKFRSGNITFEQWEMFNNLTPEDRALRFRDLKKEATPPTPREKFYFVKAIQVTVPEDYDHATQLTTFHNKNYEKFSSYNSNITDGDFSKVSHRLVPGKTYTVKIFGIHKSEVATSKECIKKYKQEKAFFVGAQGVSVLWEENRKDLPKGKWYASFDEKENLPVADGYHWVPHVFARSRGDFDFRLGNFEDDWNDRDCLLCFCDLGDVQSSVA